jgi:hypothetical protein
MIEILLTYALYRLAYAASSRTLLGCVLPKQGFAGVYNTIDMDKPCMKIEGTKDNQLRSVI